jgi:hypothetical protein
MYNFLKIATLNLWAFEYSRSDFQNLFDDMEYEKVHLFMTQSQLIQHLLILVMKMKPILVK